MMPNMIELSFRGAKNKIEWVGVGLVGFTNDAVRHSTMPFTLYFRNGLKIIKNLL